MAATTGSPYPARFIDNGTDEIANWRPLAHWLLAIPHLFIAGVLGYIVGIVAFVSWFIILFTGKLPAGIAGFQTMVMRYTTRAHGYTVGLTEDYPPFEFDAVTADPGTYSLGVDVEPELEGRNRVTVFFRFFLLIPGVIVMYVYAIIWFFVGLIAWFAVLFTGRYPEGLRRITVGLTDFVVRFQAYANLLTDRFTPLNLT